MAFQQNGYILIPGAVLTYDTWREYALTHGVNVDWRWGNQCWDICALLWYQYGLRLQTGNGKAYGCWTLMRDVNARPPFTQVTKLEDVKRGDCIVLGQAGSLLTGHICFADEDYNGTTYLYCVGQNQGQGVSYGTPSIRAHLSVRQFLGAFRNTNWQSAPEPPAPEITGSEVKKRKFPWAIYDRKFRHRY